MRLKRYIAQWESAELPVIVVQAPNWIVSFDKIIVIYAGIGSKTIRRVAAYSSKEDKIISEH